jgi:hypothetical protein
MDFQNTMWRTALDWFNQYPTERGRICERGQRLFVEEAVIFFYISRRYGGVIQVFFMSVRVILIGGYEIGIGGRGGGGGGTIIN